MDGGRGSVGAILLNQPLLYRIHRPDYEARAVSTRLNKIDEGIASLRRATWSPVKASMSRRMWDFGNISQWNWPALLTLSIAMNSLSCLELPVSWRIARSPLNTRTS